MDKTLTLEEAVKALDELAEQAFWAVRNDTEKADQWINSRYYPLLNTLKNFLKE